MLPRSRLPWTQPSSIDPSGGDDAVPSVCSASLLTIAEESHSRVHPGAIQTLINKHGPGTFGKHSIVACQGVDLDSAAAN